MLQYTLQVCNIYRCMNYSDVLGSRLKAGHLPVTRLLPFSLQPLSLSPLPQDLFSCNVSELATLRSQLGQERSVTYLLQVCYTLGERSAALRE